jgi:lipid-binding SYLF domain-containing protein
MKLKHYFAAAVACLMFANVALAAREVTDYSETQAKFSKNATVVPFFGSAYGYALFPTIGKGGLGIGGAHGKGQVYEGGKVTGFTSLTDLSIGFQAGGEAYSQVIFFENQEAYENFISGNFEFSAQASAIAIQATAGAATGTEGGSGAGATSGNTETAKRTKAEYSEGVLVFTMAKGGLMYAATVAGQKYSFDAVK